MVQEIMLIVQDKTFSGKVTSWSWFIGMTSAKQEMNKKNSWRQIRRRIESLQIVMTACEKFWRVKKSSILSLMLFQHGCAYLFVSAVIKHSLSLPSFLFFLCTFLPPHVPSPLLWLWSKSLKAYHCHELNIFNGTLRWLQRALHIRLSEFQVH